VVVSTGAVIAATTSDWGGGCSTISIERYDTRAIYGILASALGAGTILGALILSVLNTMLTFLNAPQSAKQVVFGLIVLGLAWLYATAVRTQ
jgi:hypothetical protein